MFGASCLKPYSILERRADAGRIVHCSPLVDPYDSRADLLARTQNSLYRKKRPAARGRGKLYDRRTCSRCLERVRATRPRR
jgi:hypothetical protein